MQKFNINRISIYLCILSVLGILYRSYLHLFFIPRWIIEEEPFAFAIVELVKTGTTNRIGYNPVIEQYLVYFVYLITHINPTTLSQYANPVIGGLTVIPVYFVFKKISTQKIAIIATTIWMFSENMVYRTSTFNSTEPLGFFLAMLSLYVYLNIKGKELIKDKIKIFCVFLVLITISIFTHTLPAMLVIGLVSLDIFLKGSKKQKLFVFIIIFLSIVFLFSPFNPNQVMISAILPSTMLSHFSLSNIFLYSITDFLLGASIFFGSVCLVAITLISLFLCRPKFSIMYEYLFGCICLFLVSWFFYSPYLVGPTRIVFYFIIPLSYFVSILVSKFKNKISIIFTLFIVVCMVLTSLNGSNTMLYINNAVTSDEYNFLEHSSLIHSTYYFGEWWTDMPLKSSLLLFSSNLTKVVLPDTFWVLEGQKVKVDLNSTKTTLKIIVNTNGTTTTVVIPPIFKYVILSPRMEKSAFFFFNTEHRTIQVNQPIPDIWKDMPDWKCVEEYKNIKIYKWTGTIIEG